MKNNFFTISKDREYYIYGYTEIGRNMFITLKNNGYHILGFLDIRAEELRKDHHGNFIEPDKDTWKHNAIIIISCQTVNVQIGIAEKLYNMGCKNIIFMAAGIKYKKGYAKMLRSIWEALLQSIICSNVDIPQYGTIKKRKKTSKYLRSYDKKVTVWIPIEILYTKTRADALKEFKELNLLSEKNLERIQDATDDPIVCSDNLKSYFDYILKHTGNCKRYMDIYSNFGKRSLEQHIDDRLQTLRIWDQELENGMDYFIDAAPIAKWNDKGYFNVLDGLHRSFYLFYKGFNKVPITITKSDYKKFYNKKIVDKLNRFYDNNLNPRSAAFPHPLFYTEFFTEKERSFLFIRLIQYLRKSKINLKKFLDLSYTDGYFSFSLKRFGFDHVTCVVNGNLQSLEMYAELLYVKDILFVDIANLKTILSNYSLIYLAEEVGSEIVKRIFKESSNRDVLIIYDFYSKRDDQPKVVISLFGTGRYTQLFGYFNQGKMREVGVFTLK